MSLNLESYEEANKLIIKIEGYLDMGSFRDFEVYIQEHILKTVTAVGINFSKCKAIDSSGMGSIIRLINDLKKRNIELVILDVPSNVKSIFKISQIDKYINFKSQVEFLSD